MGFWEMALLASALSIDAVNIGVSCGLDGVKIPCLSRMLIVLVTILTTGVSVMIGEMFQGKIPQSAGAFVSGGLLFLLGLYMLFCGVKKYRAKKREQPLNQQEGRVKKGRKRFSPVRVLSDAQCCDSDRSRRIEGKEAVVIGLALSGDSAAAGFGAGLGCGAAVFFVPLLCGVFQYVFLLTGEKGAAHLRAKGVIRPEIFSMIAGGILLLTAAARFFG